MSEALHPCGLDEEAADFVLTNAGTISVEKMTQLLGVSKRTMEKAVKKLAIPMGVEHDLPPGFELGYLPSGTVRFETKRGQITRIPCSTPGIVSRTFYTQWNRQDKEDINQPA